MAKKLEINYSWNEIIQEIGKKKNKQKVKTPPNDLNGWNNENIQNPKTDGEYQCLVKWYNQDGYHYAIFEYSTKTMCWNVTDSAEHLLWTELKPKPF